MLSEVEESMEPMATMKSTMYRALVHISEAKTHSLTIQVMCDAWMSELSYARSSEALSKQLLSCGRTNGIIKSEQEPAQKSGKRLEQQGNGQHEDHAYR